MDCAMKRDVRRFVFYRWRLLSCPRRVPVNLTAEWHARFGFVPPFLNGAVAGSHFLVEDGRAVAIARPNRLQITDSTRAQMFAVIGVNHRVETVRLARAGEAPDLRAPDRLPTPADVAAVEEWPPPEERCESLVAEHVYGPGVFMADRLDGWHATSRVEEALLFASQAEVEDRLELVVPTPLLILRYVTAARAEADQREAALVDEHGAGWHA